MINANKYCSEMMKKHFNKDIVMNKEDNEDFINSTKCWICDNDYVDNDVITGKYWALNIEIVMLILN